LWYAAYTTANHEKRVAEQLAVRSVEHFLPQYASVRRWKDRRVRLELPLFPGYVFVRLALRDRLQVLKIPGVAKLVGFNGTPTALPEEEIATLRTSLAMWRSRRAAPLSDCRTQNSNQGGPSHRTRGYSAAPKGECAGRAIGRSLAAVHFHRHGSGRRGAG
jgi:transcription antitermination factor NusG